ncbi:yjeF N-terminal domain-containing protein 3 isoform X2 [Meles meles]|uniref:yjeF N-terminal domain-containing protein 3 isoform X2 n=1 Tax=Meles meles TaxID=9662 RepID=UPI001E69CEEC|nr:yjeF N-terminal domain-containing protein 3 isoform X2 [Meles meles]
MSSAARQDPAEAPEERRFLSTAEAAALERELLEDYRFGRQQLVELCGHASAVAVTKVFPLPSLSRKQRTVLVVCGPEQNGAVGLVCARHLRMFEYEPTIFYPTRSLDGLHQDLTTQCEKMDIPFLSYLPTEVQLINDAYGLVVDAVLGPGVQPGEIGGPCTRALATLKLLSIPLVSLDIPSGMPGRKGGLWGALVGALCTPASGGPSLSLSLSFPCMDGFCTLGEGHAHPSEREDRGCCPGDPLSHPPPTQPSMPAAHPGPVAWADVSSLGKGLTHPGRRPTPVGAIRRRADGTNSCWPAGPSTGVATLRGCPPDCKTSGPSHQGATERGLSYREMGCLV